MLTGLHLLLTYRCTHACDHCFLSCSPWRDGTFTPEMIDLVMDQAERIGTIDTVYFEGGEPFLYYPLLLHGVRAASEAGFTVGVVTNSYWAESDGLADLFLAPLLGAGLKILTVSDDAFHWGEEADTPPKRAVAAAGRLGLDAGSICIPHPAEDEGVRFRGRAAHKLTEGRPTSPAESFTKCPDEDFFDPGRVHLDGLGNVHLCQGLVMGNFLERPLEEIVAGWNPRAHPIAGPLTEGGPAKLAESIAPELSKSAFVDACHLCYTARRVARERFPAELAPPGVYDPD
jgi:Radical SAM superfamily